MVNRFGAWRFALLQLYVMEVDLIEDSSQFFQLFIRYVVEPPVAHALLISGYKEGRHTAEFLFKVILQGRSDAIVVGVVFRVLGALKLWIGLVHCCTLFLCYLDAEIGYRVGTPYRRL